MKRKIVVLVASLPALAGLVLWATSADAGLPGSLLRAYALAFVLLTAIWWFSRGLRIFLWRVSRRLAFSYLLMGLAPLILGFLLVAVALYVLAGFYTSHLYRDALFGLSDDLYEVARHHLRQRSVPRSDTSLPLKVAYYKNGKRILGNPDAPGRWPSWFPSVGLEAGRRGNDTDAGPELLTPWMVTAPDGSPTLMVAVEDPPWGLLAIYDGDLGRELSQRSGVWIELLRADDERVQNAFTVTIRQRDYPLKPPRPAEASGELARFLHPGTDEPGFLDRPSVLWVDMWQPFVDLESGAPAADFVSATLTTNLRSLNSTLVSTSAEVGSWVYLWFVALALLLFNIWVLAVFMAVLMIFGLSRAVNRLTDATRRVQRGDFSARIDVHRRDQIGALQTSFNVMAENLETLVAQAARKEILEKDLLFAQELQRSLLPDLGALPRSSALAFAGHFEPCTAIGGDYFDILPIDEERLAVVIADVSGHGVSAGLRMAMVKSALQVLCEPHVLCPDGTAGGDGESGDVPAHAGPDQVLGQLHELLRSGFYRGHQRGFVTATLAVVDVALGRLTVTNAGHPPTYLLRRGDVREILLPSPPLGALPGDFGHATVELEPGDRLVWLSDGLIEAQNGHGDFGYERVVETLTGLDGDPAAVKDRLLEAVAAHTGGQPPEDDRTLVVMGYRLRDAAS